MLLVGGGAVAAVVGIVRLAKEAGPADERVVARGTVAALDGPRDPGRHVQHRRRRDAHGLAARRRARATSRETVVAGTACEIVRPTDTRAQIRGSRQGTSVETDHHATIGEFTSSAGRNAVACAHVPFGRVRRRGRLREERPFIVERGSPGDGLRGLWLLFRGIAAIVLGVPVASRWRVGSLKT